MKILTLLIFLLLPIFSFAQPVCQISEDLNNGCTDLVDNDGDGFTDIAQDSDCPCGGNQNGGNIVCNVFVTSGTFLGDLVEAAENLPCFTNGMNGIEAADCICQDHADNAGLSGTYYAWLSMIADNGVITTPGSRFLQVSRPETIEFRLVDPARSIIETNFSGLIDSNGLDRPLNVIENGDIAPAGISTVFTGTLNNGTASQNDCNEWETPSNSSRGINGSARVSLNWSDRLMPGPGSNEEDCNTRRALYCFQQ